MSGAKTPGTVRTDLRAAAGRRNNDAAVASTLRCLETALEQAALATDLLREGSVRRISGAWPEGYATNSSFDMLPSVSVSAASKLGANRSLASSFVILPF